MSIEEPSSYGENRDFRGEKLLFQLEVDPSLEGDSLQFIFDYGNTFKENFELAETLHTFSSSFYEAVEKCAKSASLELDGHPLLGGAIPVLFNEIENGYYDFETDTFYDVMEKSLAFGAGDTIHFYEAKIRTDERTGEIIDMSAVGLCLINDIHNGMSFSLYKSINPTDNAFELLTYFVDEDNQTHYSINADALMALTDASSEFLVEGCIDEVDEDEAYRVRSIISQFQDFIDIELDIYESNDRPDED